MKTSKKYRERIPDVKRVIVKIGSRVIVRGDGRLDIGSMKGLVEELAQLKRTGYEIAVVSSGAVSAGMECLGMRERPACMHDLQMAAAVGQARLTSVYGELFAASGLKVGQMLLTRDDFSCEARTANVRRTMERLIGNRVVPVINENDVVSDESIDDGPALGCNDTLASLLAGLVGAELLIMLTTVDGVRETMDCGRTRRVRCIESITNQTFSLVRPERSPFGKGGMGAKLEAALKTSQAGCSAVIANGRERGILTRVMRGEDAGTFILALGTTA
jgi:glutamate 5-kinase